VHEEPYHWSDSRCGDRGCRSFRLGIGGFDVQSSDDTRGARRSMLRTCELIEPTNVQKVAAEVCKDAFDSYHPTVPSTLACGSFFGKARGLLGPDHACAARRLNRRSLQSNAARALNCRGTASVV